MSMEVKAQHSEHFLSSFAKTIGSKVKNMRVNIPSKYGSGYVLGYLFGDDLRMIVRHYELKQNLHITRQPDNLPSSMIMISFQNILIYEKDKPTDSSVKRMPLPSVTISTQGLEPELSIASNTNFNTIKLAIQSSYLKELLDSPIENTVIRNIIENKQPLLFEQFISAELQKIAQEITDTQIEESLEKFFYKLKAEELICYLLMLLLQREHNNLRSINAADIKALYAVKEKLIDDLAAAPSLDELATYANMSESKLKRLFKQVFGNTIYNYYQNIRMQEAARLLKNEKQSVSQVGYALGFSNLSHFTRMFEEHVGMKPKKFSMM